MIKKILFTITISLFLLMNTHSQVNRFVNPDATGNKNGTSWANAYTSIQDALNAAPTNLTPGSIYRIWVKAGVYKPGNQRINFFHFRKNQIRIYGGFNGTETHISQRNINQNKTILSGDLNDNDNGSLNINDATRQDNSFRVVVVEAVGVVIDGFTITGGNANGTLSGQDRGAGMSAHNGSFSLTVRDCIIENNLASFAGGAIIIDESTAGTSFMDQSFERCLFRHNEAELGGVFFIRQNLISGANSNPPRVTIVNSIAYGNKATNVNNNFGGSFMWINNNNANSGGINKFITVYVRNSTIANNVDDNADGGVIVAGSNNSGALIRLRMDNSIFYNNKKQGIVSPTFSSWNFSNPATAVVESSHSEDNFSTVSNNNKANFINGNPNFIDAANNDFRLMSNSPCIDSGSNAIGAGSGTVDYAGNTRTVNNTIDMGAFEFDASLNTKDFSSKNLTIFPNPISETIQLKNPKNHIISKIIIYNSLGQTVLQKNSFPLNVEQLDKGIYFIKLKLDNNDEVIKKVIKK
ncbi:T9SS type A sorting domain-containing protein [Polaribacter porphyrae]|nr:T9SS type A sorting domain-containing protein [Polaribacter porphyrae]